MVSTAQLEILGFVLAITYVVLATYEINGCWPFGIACSLVYAFLFYDAHLYADAGLQCVYLVLCVWGWVQWQGRDRMPLRVSQISSKGLTLSLLTAGTLTLVISHFLSTYLSGSLPYLDALTTSLSLVAQYMVAKKYLENWIFWIVANVFFIAMYITKGLWVTTVLYVVFTLLAIHGFRTWRAQLRTQT